MDGKFAGVGLTNVLILFLLITVLSVIAKVVFTKHYVQGLSEVIIAS